MLQVDSEVDKYVLKHEFKHEFCAHWMPLLQRTFPQADIIIDKDEFEGIECISACVFTRIYSEEWLVERLSQYYKELQIRCSKRFIKIVALRINPGREEETDE